MAQYMVVFCPPFCNKNCISGVKIIGIHPTLDDAEKSVTDRFGVLDARLEEDFEGKLVTSRCEENCVIGYTLPKGKAEKHYPIWCNCGDSTVYIVKISDLTKIWEVSENLEEYYNW